MQITIKTFGGLLRATGLSQRAVAKLAGLHRNTVWNLSRGSHPDDATAKKLASALSARLGHRLTADDVRTLCAGTHGDEAGEASAE